MNLKRPNESPTGDQVGGLPAGLHPRLREHLTAAIALMRASSTWDQFRRSINRALPKWNETMPLDLDE